MNIQTIFENFLVKVVNLNKDRVKRIEDAQRTLSEFIKGQDGFKNLYIDTVPQGSFRQKTIIKPVGEDGTFDVDLLIKLEENLDWSPADYLANLATAFSDSGRYEDLTDTKGKTRCVTIDYEGDFHVDLVPVVERASGDFICNKTTDEFEETDGDGYAQWFERQDAAANGYLVPAVRLLKYLRDFQEEFNTKSIILTTIAGMQVHPEDSFSNIPEAFSVVLTRMNDFLSQFENAPSISNPAAPGETFDRHWKNDEEGFDKFKATISTYADIAVEAMEITDTEEAIKHWRKLLGDKFSNDGTDGKGLSGATASSIAASTGSRSFTPSSPYASE